MLIGGWQFAPVREADFEPLLAIRIDVMREHLERVSRYEPTRARRIFRAHFDEPGLRRITIEGQTAGCVGFRRGPAEITLDSFYLTGRFHNRGLGTGILTVLLAEADDAGLPITLDVLIGSPASRFYERHGFVKQHEDTIEARYRRPVINPAAA